MGLRRSFVSSSDLTFFRLYIHMHTCIYILYIILDKCKMLWFLKVKQHCCHLSFVFPSSVSTSLCPGILFSTSCHLYPAIPLQSHPAVSLYLPGWCIYPCFVLTYEDLELGTADEGGNEAFVFLRLGYLTQYNLFWFHRQYDLYLALWPVMYESLHQPLSTGNRIFDQSWDQFYRYMYGYLECTLTSWSFSKITVGSPSTSYVSSHKRKLTVMDIKSYAIGLIANWYGRSFLYMSCFYWLMDKAFWGNGLAQ